MQQYKPDQEHIRMLEALATVSSLAFMAVIDFMLAYFGGDWLDRHLETGDHTMRGICIALAVISLIMTYYNLIQTVPDRRADYAGSVCRTRHDGVDL